MKPKEQLDPCIQNCVCGRPRVSGKDHMIMGDEEGKRKLGG